MSNEHGVVLGLPFPSGVDHEARSVEDCPNAAMHVLALFRLGTPGHGCDKPWRRNLCWGEHSLEEVSGCEEVRQPSHEAVVCVTVGWPAVNDMTLDMHLCAHCYRRLFPDPVMAEAETVT